MNVNIQVLQVYSHYVHTYTKLHTCTINKHTYQGQYKIKYLHKYIYINYITLRHNMQNINKV